MTFDAVQRCLLLALLWLLLLLLDSFSKHPQFIWISMHQKSCVWLRCSKYCAVRSAASSSHAYHKCQLSDNSTKRQDDKGQAYSKANLSSYVVLYDCVANPASLDDGGGKGSTGNKHSKSTVNAIKFDPTKYLSRIALLVLTPSRHQIL